MLAYIHSADRGVPNAVLSDVAGRLQARSVRVAGLVQVRAPEDGAHPCDMDLHCLPDGPTFAIAQKLGRGARGCRMDIDALETGVAYVSQAVRDGAEVFILNKFGAQEAQGRGFAETIALALERGVPVLTVVNPLNLDAFRGFAGGVEAEIAADADTIDAWITARLPGRA